MERKKENQQKTLAARQVEEQVHADEQSVGKTALQFTTSKPHYMLNSAERPNLSGYHLRVHLPLITNNQLPSGLVATLVEQRWLWVRTPPRIFSLSPCRPISFLRLSLRNYHLGCEYSTLIHYIYVRKTDRQHTDT